MTKLEPIKKSETHYEIMCQLHIAHEMIFKSSLTVDERVALVMQLMIMVKTVTSK